MFLMLYRLTNTYLLAALLITVIIFIGCDRSPEAEISSAEDHPDRFVQKFAGAIERAHGKAEYLKKQAVKMDFVMARGGMNVVEGTFIIETGSKRRVKAFMADGTVLIFDGESAWVSPQSSGVRRARFHLLTWPWFFTAPFKLIDPGSRLTALGQRKL